MHRQASFLLIFSISGFFGWMGAFLAMSLKGDYLADYKFSVRARGFIDGPSAGALLSATMLAMLTGTPIKPKVAMTGALNPDMSIGPVGGIPQKLLAAVKAGIELFCYPAPQSSVWDANFRTAVEVQELARRHGLSARPIRDLRDAYQCLTGQALPQEDRVVEADVMKDSFAQMRAITESWLARSRASFARKGGDVNKLLTSLEPLLQKRGDDLNPVVLRQLGYAAQHLQDESLAGALAALGASLQSYVDASYLLASGYLREFYETNDKLKEKTPRPGPAQRDPGGGADEAASFTTYMDLLEYADRKARESATRAQRVLGAIPSAVRFHYLAGRDQLIHGDEAQKQLSLYEFWYASALADLAVQLAAGPAGLRPVAAN